MSDMEIKLAHLTQAVLDSSTLDALFKDLVEFTDILGVLTKGGSKQRTNKTEVGLIEGKELLQHGTVQAIQIHYVYNEAQWRDTLIRRPDGIQLVRMEMKFE
jgi:hypothetical protein